MVNWGQVITNSVSMLVASVFVGAAYIVWDAASSMDGRIEAANFGLENTQEAILGTQGILKNEISDLQSQISGLSRQMDELRNAVIQTTTNSGEVSTLSVKKWAHTPTPPEVIKQFQKDNYQRLTKELEPYQKTIKGE